MRYRFAGNRMIATVVDAAKKEPFRHSDLSPREELEAARKHLAMLKATSSRYPDFPEVQWNFSAEEEKIRRLAAVVREQDFVRDSAAPQGVATLADLNRRNATFWEGRR